MATLEVTDNQGRLFGIVESFCGPISALPVVPAERFDDFTDVLIGDHVNFAFLIPGTEPQKLGNLCFRRLR